MARAARWTRPSLLRHSSANFGTRAGGRLSTQKKPRSSNTFIVFDFPAPDSPVMMRNWMSATGSRTCRRLAADLGTNTSRPSSYR